MARRYNNYSELRPFIGPYSAVYNDKRSYGRRIKFYNVDLPDLALMCKFRITCIMRVMYPNCTITIKSWAQKFHFGTIHSTVIYIKGDTDGN